MYVQGDASTSLLLILVIVCKILATLCYLSCTLINDAESVSLTRHFVLHIMQSCMRYWVIPLFLYKYRHIWPTLFLWTDYDNTALSKQLISVCQRTSRRCDLRRVRLGKVAIVAIFLVVSTGQWSVSEACGRQAIYLKNNGYRQILLAISDNVPEDSALLERIKEVFTKASAFLYQITKKVFFFKFRTI